MEIKYEIEKEIGVLSQRDSGWVKELNIVNWNDKGGKFDIREWSPDHVKMSKGITLSEDELFKLYELLKEYFNDEPREINVRPDTKIQDIFLKRNEGE